MYIINEYVVDSHLIKCHSVCIGARVKSQVCEISLATAESGRELIHSDTVNEMCSITAYDRGIMGNEFCVIMMIPFHRV